MPPPPKGSAEYERCKNGIWKGNETVWHAWEPACDTCGRTESKAPMGKLLTCSKCIVAKYCSRECQQMDWKGGHKNNECHLYEANRKLSSVFAKSLGPGTLNDPRLTLKDKAVEWNFLNAANHLVIAAAALKNDPTFAGTKNIAILLSLSKERAGSKYEHRTFFIDRVLLLNKEASNAASRVAGWTEGSRSLADSQETAERTDDQHFKVMVGWCDLPNGDTSATQAWCYHVSDAAEHVLPPGFDLNRYVSHVNRGITHFHASWVPLPRDISDDDIESMEMPKGWWDYVKRHDDLLAGMKGGQGLVGRIREDGTRQPMYKWDNSGHFRRCAPGETDFDVAEEFKKQMVDPSKMVTLISKHLAIFEAEKRAAMETNLTKSFDPTVRIKDFMKRAGVDHRI
ncbi:hypothetical protein MSAN_00870100 [Mycena sanguinolenta]|uniref:MYND-type domain-containing protein n=1 Tax=Mycena sanguinolenta TaxID=230812 RepID=A0A8H6YZH4_9AGAR|nr:hypothetical protein MSAN_00870100 [Mycena sanguinolenta]